MRLFPIPYTDRLAVFFTAIILSTGLTAHGSPAANQLDVDAARAHGSCPGADLTRADLTGADTTGAITDAMTICPDGSAGSCNS